MIHHSSLRNPRFRAALEAHLRYQNAATVPGGAIESAQMREQARLLENDGQEEESFRLYSQALELFAADDDSAAAAAASFDLSSSYLVRKKGDGRTSLMRAWALAERAAMSPARQQDPIRHAKTLDLKAKIARDLDRLDVAFADGPSTRDRALQYHRQALRIVENLGLPLRGQAAILRLHEANTLRAMDLPLRAQSALETAYGHIRHFRDGESKGLVVHGVLHASPKVDSSIAAALADSLTQRGRKKTLRRILGLCREAIDGAGDQANLSGGPRLTRIQALWDLGDETQRDLALRELAEMQKEGVPASCLKAFAQLAGRLERPMDACNALLVVAHRLVAERSEAAAQQAADGIAAHAQRASAAAARAAVLADDPIKAFLALEVACGLRMHDSMTAYFHMPKSRLDWELQRANSVWSQIAAFMDWLRLMVAPMPASAAKIVLAQHIDPNDVAGTAQTPAFERRAWPWCQGKIERAIAASDPAFALETATREATEITQALERQLVDRDPTFSRRSQPWSWPLDRERLTVGLRKNPQTVVVHASWQEDLLLIAVWLHDGQLRSNALTIPLDLNDAVALRPIADGEVVDESRRRQDKLRALVNFDVETLFQSCEEKHLVVIPSFLASWIPWPLVGTPGATLLDRFASISQVFSFTGLEFQQAPRPRRIGGLAVAPGTAVERGTMGHAIGLQQHIAGEKMLLGSEATVDRVLDQSLMHDVITFFCHGLHGDELKDGGANPMNPDEGALLLADGELRPSLASNALEGAERVELWACRSGVNLPVDPLGAQILDDGFGMDATLLRLGARTAIGSLVRVPDVVAGHLLRRHRQHLAEGVRPDVALAKAMRWWRDEMCPQLHDCAVGRTRHEAELAIAELLEVGHGDVTRLCFLGPVLGDAKLSTEETGVLLQELCGVHAWAMYRFLGICGRRPDGDWNPELDLSLTEQDAAAIDALIQSATTEDSAPVGDDSEPWCAAARNHAPGEPVAAELALAVARGYQRRQHGSFVVNICRGLAWAQEALLNPKVNPNLAAELRSEEAWLWLELLRTDGWWPHPALRSPPNPAFLARLGGVVDRSARPRDMVVRAWCAFLTMPYGKDVVTEEAWAGLLDAAMQAALSLPANSTEGLRCRAGLAELLVEAAPTATELPAELDVRLQFAQIDADEVVFWLARLDAAYCAVGVRLGGAPKQIPVQVMSSRVATAMWFAHGQAAAIGGSATESTARAQSDIVNHLERQVWGSPSDGGERVRTQPGAPGDGWHAVVGAYITGTLRQDADHARIPHLLASLSMGADLHVTAQMQMARVAQGQPNGPPWRPWSDPRNLTTTANVLQELAQQQPKIGTNGAVSKATMQAAARPAAEFLAMVESVEGIAAWTGAMVINRFLPEALAHTVPFALELTMLRLEQTCIESARALDQMYGELQPAQDEGGPATSIIVPNRRLLDHEDALNAMQRGAAVLGVVLGPYGEIALMSLFGGDDGPTTRSWLSAPGVGSKLRKLLSRLLELRAAANAQARRTVWDEISAELADGLAVVLEPGADGPARDLLILAPGPLRELPWGGLRAGNKALFESCTSVCLLPTLDYANHARRGVQPTDAAVEICLCPRDGERQRSPLTAHVIDRLRDFSPRTIEIGPDGPDGLVEMLIRHSRNSRAQVRGLRVTGSAADHIPSPSVGGVVLGAEVPLLPGNAQELFAPLGRWAEIWVPTTSEDRAASLRLTAEDRLPPLPRTLLEAGFAGVLDVAWQLPDFVQAVLVEACAVFRDSVGLDACPATTAAQRAVYQMLILVRAPNSPPTTWQDALARLDDARCTVWAEHAPKWTVAAFVGQHFVWLDHTIDPAVWLLMTDPTHVGAVRWWGV